MFRAAGRNDGNMLQLQKLRIKAEKNSNNKKVIYWHKRIVQFLSQEVFKDS